MKKIKEMTDTERTSFKESLNRFIELSLPRVRSMAGAGEIALMNRGLDMLSATDEYADFVEEVKASGNYAKYAEAFKANITELSQMLPAMCRDNTKRPGRPTAEEAKAKAIKAAKEKEEREKREPGVFQPEELDTPITDMTLLRGKLHLNQLAWLLPEHLRKQSEEIRTLRKAFETESEAAKNLAMQGKDSATVAEHANAAHDINEVIQKFYKDVDYALAELFVRLCDDERTIAQMKPKVRDIADLKSLLRPYYTKVNEEDPTFRATIDERIKEESPEAVKAKEGEKAKKKEVEDIIRYLRRTDRKMSRTVYDKMLKRFARLTELIGEDEANVYTPILDSAKAEIEKDEETKKKREEI